MKVPGRLFTHFTQGIGTTVPLLGPTTRYLVWYLTYGTRSHIGGLSTSVSRGGFTTVSSDTRVTTALPCKIFSRRTLRLKSKGVKIYDR